MSTRAQDLASRFEQANHDLIATVEGLSDAQWRTKTADEGWTVGVVAHHVAGGHQGIAEMVRRIANSEPVVFDMEAIHKGNADHAVRFANATRAETLALLRQNGAAALATIRGFG